MIKKRFKVKNNNTTTYYYQSANSNTANISNTVFKNVASTEILYNIFNEPVELVVGFADGTFEHRQLK